MTTTTTTCPAWCRSDHSESTNHVGSTVTVANGWDDDPIRVGASSSPDDPHGDTGSLVSIDWRGDGVLVTTEQAIELGYAILLVAQKARVQA